MLIHFALVKLSVNGAPDICTKLSAGWKALVPERLMYREEPCPIGLHLRRGRSCGGSARASTRIDQTSFYADSRLL
eukprot:s1376_g7.t1